jgi:hypothetical protein
MLHSHHPSTYTCTYTFCRRKELHYRRDLLTMLLLVQVVPEAAVIPGTPVQAGIDPVTGQPLPEQKVTTMAAPTTVTAAQAAPGVHQNK